MPRRPAVLFVSAALLGLLVLPGAATAKPTAAASAANLVNALAADACGAEKAEIGKRAFRKRYGAKKPMRACVKRAKPDARNAVGEATDECLMELEEYGSEEFYARMGDFLRLRRGLRRLDHGRRRVRGRRGGGRGRRGGRGVTAPWWARA